MSGLEEQSLLLGGQRSRRHRSVADWRAVPCHHAPSSVLEAMLSACHSAAAHGPGKEHGVRGLEGLSVMAWGLSERNSPQTHVRSH